MPNKASHNSAEFIYQSINSTLEDFTQNSSVMEPDLYEWATNFRFRSSDEEIKDPFQAVTDFQFVGEKNKNYGLQQEMKETFHQMFDYIASQNKTGGFIDYDEWNQKVTQNLPVFKEKLDAFNEATNYDYINKPEMRCLNMIINRMNAADITVQNCEYSEPLVGIKSSANSLDEDLEDLKIQEADYLKFCDNNNINPDSVEKEIQAYSQIEKEINHIARHGEQELEQLLQDREELNKKQQFEQVLKETTVFLVNKKYANSKKSDLQEELNEVQTDQIVNWQEVPEQLENATKAVSQLADFQRDHDPKSSTYIIDFIKIDPENKADLLNPTELDAYKEKINKMTPQQLEQYITDASAAHNKTIDSFKKNPEVKDFIESFETVEELKRKIFVQKQKDALADSNLNKGIQKLSEMNKELKNPENITARLKATWDKLSKLSTDDLRETRTSIRESAEKKPKPTAKMKALDDVIESRRKIIGFCKKSKDDMSDDASYVQEANDKRKEVIAAQKAFDRKAENLRQKANIVDPDTRVKNTTQSFLDRFSNQIDKCTRLGHVNSEAFTNMQTALKNAQKDATPENLKAMKEAADAYLEARKNDHSLFATKMRRHRLDLAKSISEFGASCATMDHTLNYAKGAKKAANDVLENSSNNVLEAQKDKNLSANKSNLKTKIGNFLQMKEQIKKNENVLSGLQKKDKAIQAPSVKQPEKKPLEKAEPGANII